MKIKETYYKKGNLIVVLTKEAYQKAHKELEFTETDDYGNDIETSVELDDILEFISYELDVIIITEGEEVLLWVNGYQQKIK